MMGRPIDWTPDMKAALCALRAEAIPLYECAERIGVCYPTCVYKARELGVADRKNRGQIPGRALLMQREVRR